MPHASRPRLLSRLFPWILPITAASFALLTGGQEAKPVTPAEPALVAGSVGEARERARLLHQTFRDTLRVVHRDFFRKGERQPIPSKTLEEVFPALETNRNVRVRWLALEATAMNLDHLPADDFEREALRRINAGQAEYEAVEQGRLRYAGLIPLQNPCLKCHAQNRTSLENRSAALEVCVPFAP